MMMVYVTFCEDIQGCLNNSGPSSHWEVRGSPCSPRVWGKWPGHLNSLSPQTQCFNFIRVLVSVNATHLYACGTFAFSPACTFIVSYWELNSQTQASLLTSTPEPSSVALENPALPDAGYL